MLFSKCCEVGLGIKNKESHEWSEWDLNAENQHARLAPKAVELASHNILGFLFLSSF